MLVQRIHSRIDAASWSDQWNSLAESVPFRQWEWLETWWHHYGAGKEWFVLAIRDSDGRLAGVAPWFRQQVSAFGRVIHFLGSGQACSDYLTVLCAERDRCRVTSALADWLMAASESHSDDGWDMLHLDGVTDEDGTMTELLARLEEHGCTVHQRSEMNTWRVPLPGSWDDYRKQLSKPNRRHVRLLQERLIDSGQLSSHVVTSRDELARVWEMLVDLHQRRRNELGQPGCFASPEFAGFARQAAELFFERDQLELLWVEQQGAPVGVQLGFLGGQTTYAYQVGTDPERRADSPGWLVHTASIKRAITLGHSAFDFLRGDESHKHRLGAKPHPLHTIRIVPPRIGPKMLHTAWVTGDAVKNWIKSGLHLTGMR
jgi:CelD/BcsL family acetyltransferase involved in cellulose biosynthesis